MSSAPSTNPPGLTPAQKDQAKTLGLNPETTSLYEYKYNKYFAKIQNLTGGAPAPAVREEISTVWADAKKRTRFVKALQAMKDSNEWRRVVGIHGGGWNIESADPEQQQWNKVFLEKAKLFVAEQNRQIPGGTDKQPVPTMLFCAHGVETFPIWHRCYVLEFEIVLQKYDPEKAAVATGNLPPLGLPYWHWDHPEQIPAVPAAATATTVLLEDGTTVPNPLFKGVPRPSDANILQPAVGSTTRNVGQPSTIAVFSKFTSTFYRQVYTSKYVTFATAAHHSVSSLESPHNSLHNFVGGDMADLSKSSWDPIFWLHHCNVERMFVQWQQNAPKVHNNVAKTGLKKQQQEWKLYPFASFNSIRAKRAWEQSEVATLADYFDYNGKVRHQYVYDPMPQPEPLLLLRGFVGGRATMPAVPALLVVTLTKELHASGTLSLKSEDAVIWEISIFTSAEKNCPTCDARAPPQFTVPVGPEILNQEAASSVQVYFVPLSSESETLIDGATVELIHDSEGATVPDFDDDEEE